MKKILFVLIAVLSAMTVSAKDDVTLASGSLKEFAEAAPADVAIVWDYSKATLEGKNVKAFLKEKGSDWVNSYPGELSAAEEFFRYKVAKQDKYFNIVDKSQAKYIITIKVADFNYGSTGASIVIGMGAGDAHMDATIEFTRKGQSKPFAVLKADGVPGSGFGNETRRKSAYYDLGKWVVKYVKKAKK